MKTNLLLVTMLVLTTACNGNGNSEGVTHHGTTVSASQIQETEDTSKIIDLLTCVQLERDPVSTWSCNDSKCTSGCAADGFSCIGTQYVLTCTVGGVSCLVTGSGGQWSSVDIWGQVYGKPGCLNL